VLAAVATAARRRRARETSRLLWRVAPIVAAAALLLAAVVRWKGATPIIPIAVLAVAGAVWILYAYMRRHGNRVTDRTASAIDDEAHLGGELRSAAWFATYGTTGTTDPWAGFHLGRAAERLESIDFVRLYPPVRARRARIATGVMIAAALGLIATFPERPHAGASVAAATPAPAPRKVLPIEVEGVPPDLPQDLEDLLAAIETGTFAAQRTADAAALLNALLALKDPKALAALARAMAAERARPNDAETMKDLADRTKRDAAMTPPSDIRAALEDLSKKLLDPERDLDTAGLEKSDEAQPNEGVDLAGSPPQSSRDASAIAGIGMVSLSKQESTETNAPPGVGVGGSSSAPGGGGTMPDIAKALRHEIIEANEDDVSGDVDSDARRKTERGSATTTFTRSAAGQSDGTRAGAPPPVPETRRAGIQTYFTRRQ
jgi:hypothetical protein